MKQKQVKMSYKREKSEIRGISRISNLNASKGHFKALGSVFKYLPVLTFNVDSLPKSEQIKITGYSEEDIEYICESCHQVLEAEITRKENEILQQYPEIYAGTFNDFLAIGKKEIDAKRRKLPFVKRRRRRRK